MFCIDCGEMIGAAPRILILRAIELKNYPRIILLDPDGLMEYKFESLSETAWTTLDLAVQEITSNRFLHGSLGYVHFAL